jgi:hypothetical protein
MDRFHYIYDLLLACSFKQPETLHCRRYQRDSFSLLCGWTRSSSFCVITVSTVQLHSCAVCVCTVNVPRGKTLTVTGTVFLWATAGSTVELHSVPQATQCTGDSQLTSGCSNAILPHCTVSPTDTCCAVPYRNCWLSFRLWMYVDSKNITNYIASGFGSSPDAST